MPPGPEIISLPAVRQAGQISVEEALVKRASVREFLPQALTMEALAQLLWAGQGITRRWGGRTAPSAGALYPLELYVVLPMGTYRYLPVTHALERHQERDLLSALGAAALGQGCVRQAAAVIAVTAVYARTERKYGTRGTRYVQMEAGHVAQNILLEAAVLGIGAVPVGAFRDDEVQEVLRLPKDHVPLYLIPLGYPRLEKKNAP